MGDLNAVDIAQAVHEKVLENSGGLKEAHKLIYGTSAPANKLWEGLYIDDHICIAVLKRCGLSRALRPDLQLMQDARVEYLKVGLDRTPKKAFTDAQKIVAWVPK